MLVTQVNTATPGRSLTAVSCSFEVFADVLLHFVQVSALQALRC
jgi:hypothetical protein